MNKNGVDAFLGCSSLEEVEFVYGGVFAPIEVGVRNVVTKITIPNTTSSNDIIDNVTPIICQGCSRLTDISISDSVTNIYYINNGVIVYAVLGFVPSQVRINLSIPSGFLNEDVVTIGSLAFNNKDNR